MNMTANGFSEFFASISINYEIRGHNGETVFLIECYRIPHGRHADKVIAMALSVPAVIRISRGAILIFGHAHMIWGR